VELYANSVGAMHAALKAAKPGDTILLAGGEYEATKLYGYKFAGEVTIASVDPAKPAVFGGLSIDSSTNLTFRDVEVSVNPSTGFAVYVAGSSGVVLDSLDLHGAAVGDGNAMMIRGSSNVVVTNSDIHHTANGINHLDSRQVTISNNTFQDIRIDGVRGAGTSDITISDNTFTNFRPTAADHPDAIQFWTINTTVGARNIKITDNTFIRGDGEPIQGIFLGNELSLPYQNVTITGNAIVGSMYHGVMVYAANNVTVSDNYVQGFKDIKSWIMLKATTNSSISGNDASAYQLASNTGLVNGVNTTVATTAVGDLRGLNAWLAEHNDASPPPSIPQSNPTSSILNGTSASDVLTGTAGADEIDGQRGADSMSGLSGNDTYVVDNAGDKVVELAAGGADTVKTFLAFYALPSQVENLTLTGTSNQSGDGNEHNNVIFSNGRKAGLNGAGGNDTLVSAGGQDRMAGGPGEDVFRFDKLPSGIAVVTDYAKGQDAVDLPPLSAAYNGADPIKDGFVKLQVDASGTTFYVDVDGPGGPGAFAVVAKLNGVATALTFGKDWLF
jgi:parallel beta-helix repeat protein